MDVVDIQIYSIDHSAETATLLNTKEVKHHTMISITFGHEKSQIF